MFLWTGLGQGCLRDYFTRACDVKNEGNERFYGFTEFRGKPQAGREGEGFTRNPESSYRRLRLYITSYSRVSTRHAAPMQHAFRTRAPRLYPRGARDPWIFASTAVAASTRLSLPDRFAPPPLPPDPYGETASTGCIALVMSDSRLPWPPTAHRIDLVARWADEQLKGAERAPEQGARQQIRARPLLPARGGARSAQAACPPCCGVRLQRACTSAGA